MILAFPAARIGYFKVIGPVIEEALRRKHTVLLYWTRDRKPGEQARYADVSHRWWSTTVITDPSPADAFIGPTLHTHDVSAWSSARLVSLDYSWEQANAPVIPGMLQCYVSDYQYRLADRHRSDWWAPTLGSTQLDAWAAARPLPSESSPMLLLFSCKLRVGGWRRFVYRYAGYRRLLTRLRRWCDTEKLRLVIKTRRKHADPAYVRQLADAVYEDTELYPPMSLRLIRSATVAVHFQSGAAMELAHAGVPQYSVTLPQPHLDGHRTTHECYSGMPYTFGYWPGVIRPLVTNPEPFAIDPDALGIYRARYLGPSNASARLLDLLERGR